MPTRRHRRYKDLSFKTRLLAVGFAVTMLMAAAPSAAQAARAFVTQSCNSQGVCTSTAKFVAAPGEVNHVTVTEQPEDTFIFRDSQRNTVPGAGCTRRGIRPPPASGAVQCRPRQIAGTDRVAPAFVLLGDQGDRVVSRTRSRLSGGTGDDYLSPRGNRGRSRVAGGRGADVLSARNTRIGHIMSGDRGGDRVYGGAGNDSITGGSGNDIVSAGNGRDSVQGGNGADRVAGNANADRVRGGRGKDVVVGGFGNDRLNGQSGNDLLIGNSGNDLLSGRSGRDRLRGGFGNDGLWGGLNRDRYRGGPGRDGIRSVDNIRERVNCGTGFDFAIVDRSPRDRVAFCNRTRRV